MIEWKPCGRYIVASVGYLFAYIEDREREPEGDDTLINWFTAPDDEDKNYRRALEDGTAETVEGAKAAVIEAFHRIRDKLVTDIEELEA